MTAEVFKESLEDMLITAKEQGFEYLEVRAGNLHRKVGGYPSGHQCMRMCCDVMFQKMSDKDEVVYTPPVGKGATVKVKYYLKN